MVKRLSNVDQNSKTLTNVPTPSAGGDAVNKTYADTKKTDTVSTNNRLLGRATAGSGAIEEIALGTGLSFSGTTLNATGGGTGDVVGPASSVNGQFAVFSGTTGKLLADSGKAAPSGVIVGTTDTQTLSAKTLSSPVLSGSLTGTYTIAGTPTFPSTVVLTTGAQTLANKTLTAPVISTITNTGTLTLPTATDTLVGRATTDTLTNKTIDGGSNTLTNIPNSSIATSFQRVIHGATAGTARPNVTHVEWIGSVAPTNGTTADTWIDTA